MRIEVPCSLDDLNQEDDNYDVFVHLNDGRVFNITVGTPCNVYRCMESEDYFLGYPFLLVRRLTPEIVATALQALAQDERFLAIYGVPLDKSTLPQPLPELRTTDQ